MTFSKRRIKRVLLMTIVIVALGSCSSVRFYTQAAKGQWEILHKARPIPEVLTDAHASDTLKRKLRLVLELREYARRELHLTAQKPFSDYTDLGRKHVVWVVFAAPEFSVEAKTWWYPLVGTLKYRGFFNEADAMSEAKSLKAKGYDVHVGGTEAYSTLGWFADPVLNTFLHRDDADLAELIFHELTHSRVFISGDTDFNEALATAFAQAGVRKWLISQGRKAELDHYEQDSAKDREIVKLLLQTRDELKAAYEEKTDKSEAKRECFALMSKRYAAIKQRWTNDSRFDRYFALPMNNARLNSVATYFDLVPGFERLLKDCDNDPDRFFAKLESMKHLPHDERRALVKGR